MAGTNQENRPDTVMLSMLPGGEDAWNAQLPPAARPSEMPWIDTVVDVRSHTDVLALLRGHAGDEAKTPVYARPPYDLGALEQQPMVMSGVWALNPPEHSEVIGHIGAFFGPQAVRRYVGGLVEREVDHTLGEIINGQSDTINYGSTLGRIPAHVIADMTGIPSGDPQMARWLTGVNSFDSSPEQIALEQEVKDGFIEVIGRAQADLVKEPRSPQTPIEALATALNNQALVAGKPMTAHMAASQVAVMHAAGEFTTATTLGNILQGMSVHDTFSTLRDSPQLVGTAAAIGTRLYTASPVAFGWTTAPHTVGKGQEAMELPPNTFVNGHINPANVDPDVFDNPFRFDPHHPDKEALSLSFATGWRTCMGMAVARAIIGQTVAAVTQRLPGFQWDGQPVRRAPFGFVRTIMPAPESHAAAPGEDSLNFKFDLEGAKVLAEERART